MKTVLASLIAAIVLLPFIRTSADAQVRAKVYVVAVPDRFKASNGNETTHGLTNVGVGARVVLKPVAVYGSSFDANSAIGVTAQSALWTVAGPDSSAVTTVTDTAAGGNNGLVVYFKPDVIGSYTVDMTVTTDSGDASASVIIHASRFVGVGVWRNGADNFAPFNCTPCHSPNAGVFATYAQTKHAQTFKTRIDEAGGHFGNNCMRCHSVGFNTAAVNGGYDEIRSAIGFNVPSNGPGVYDSLLHVADSLHNLGSPNDSLLTLIGLAGIQCESCHGPASEHKRTGNYNLIAKKHSSDVCAPCHFSSDRHPKGYSWENSLHAASKGEGEEAPNYMNRNSCSRCHVGQGFVNETIRGNVAPTSGYLNAEPIGCVTCHDPHSNLGMERQLRRGTIREACTGCHTTRISSRGLHHSHQGQLLVGVESTPMNATLNTPSIGDFSGWQLPGYSYENSGHSDIEERCVKCHMAASPDFDPTFQSPDTLLNVVGGHTWRVKWTDVNGTHINNMGCAGGGCHGGTLADVKSYVDASQSQLKTLLDTLKFYLPKRPPTANPNPNDPKFPTEAGLTTVQAAAAYNYWFVLNDGSYGVHNATYARQLLTSSIEQLKLGAGAAQVVSVADIPGDQGMRVQVVWNKFPAEDFAYEAVVNYGVWRQDPEFGAAGKVIPRKSYSEMLQQGTVGEKYSVNGFVWTYVANVPASNHPKYSYVAPTLADSSASNSPEILFYVAGYSVDNLVTYASAPFGGRSIDNLPPLRVLDFTVTLGPSGASLAWKPNPDDEEVVRYLVYRGTTSDFTPAFPLTEVASPGYVDAGAASGGPYWYVVRGVDDAGNPGVLTSSVGTTNVEQLEGIPTEYNLAQNYPNPFNPTTTIRFSLPQSGSVLLQVYSVSGELVRTLTTGAFPAGNFVAIWNGTDDAGNTVASGLYLYRISSGEFRGVKKMVLLK